MRLVRICEAGPVSGEPSVVILPGLSHHAVPTDEAAIGHATQFARDGRCARALDDVNRVVSGARDRDSLDCCRGDSARTEPGVGLRTGPTELFDARG